MKIHISQATKKNIEVTSVSNRTKYIISDAHPMEIKGKGSMNTFYITSKEAAVNKTSSHVFFTPKSPSNRSLNLDKSRCPFMDVYEEVKKSRESDINSHPFDKHGSENSTLHSTDNSSKQETSPVALEKHNANLSPTTTWTRSITKPATATCTML